MRALLASGHDRRRTAEALHVHPNTVDYRLGRIARACGIDPADPAGRPAALAALAVRDLERHRAR
ncbi:helix-turn-helix domain-containing protein [Geodermatophilus sp. SYSU D01176]